MACVTGKSLVPVSIQAFGSFISSVIPAGKLEDFEIKLDGRAKVKSVFAKLENNVLTIYTGAIVSIGSVKFPEVPDASSLLMLFTIYGIKKAGLGEDFEVKSTDQGISEIKVDSNFQMLTGNLHLFMDKFNAFSKSFVPVEPVAPVQEVKEQKQEMAVTEVTTFEPEPEKKVKRSSNDSPYKGVPLENTPKIEVPADLDLKAV